MAEQTAVTLNPSEAKVVVFEATPHEAKTYQVSVNGLAGSFVAKLPPAPVVLTLRPNSDVQHPNWSRYPASGAWYDKVDDVTSDENSTYVYIGAMAKTNDTYFLIKENGVLTVAGGGGPWWKEYHTVSHIWSTRPSDGQPFTVADIDALQVGVRSFKGKYGITSNMLFGLPACGIVGTINSVTLYYREMYTYGDPQVENRVTQVYVEVDYTP